MSINADKKDCVCSNNESVDSDSILSKIISKFATHTESNLSLQIINRDDDSLNSFSSLTTKNNKRENFQNLKKIQHENEKSIKIQIKDDDDDNFTKDKIKIRKKMILQKNKLLLNARKNTNIFKIFPQASHF